MQISQPRVGNKAPEATLARFVISTSNLGKGSYGYVLLAYDLFNQHAVAVKLIRKGRMKKSSIENEMCVLRRLSDSQHPSFVKFYSYLSPLEFKLSCTSSPCIDIDGEYHACLLYTSPSPRDS